MIADDSPSPEAGTAAPSVTPVGGGTDTEGSRAHRGADSDAGHEWERWSDRWRPWIERRHRLVEAALCAVAAGGAWWFRFAQDDAFITYRFARNMARGDGLVFNPGERVEGYTNFLWTLMHVVPERVGWDAPTFSTVVGIVVIVATLLAAIRLAERLTGDRVHALAAATLLVACASFIGYGTSGLETMMQTLFITVFAWALTPSALGSPERTHLTARRVVAGAAGGLALLTRLDSAVLLGAWFAVHVWSQRREPSPPTAAEGGRTAARWAAEVLRAGALVGLPTLAIVVPWLVWKADFYGTLVPNTREAKSTSNPLVPFLYGIFYLGAFFVTYGAFVLVPRWRRLRGTFFADPARRAAFAVVAVWFVYICVVGADFMEYRFLVPVLPVLALLAAHLVDRVATPLRQGLIVGTLVVASAAHLLLPSVGFPVLWFTDLHHWPTESHTSWKAMGELLGREFPGGSKRPGQPVIALEPLGVIAYYSDLPTIDMLGLADPWVAQHGFEIPSASPLAYYPGHVKMAPISYLERRKVNLLIGLPQIHKYEPGERRATSVNFTDLLYVFQDLHELPRDATVIEIPLDEQKVWRITYLTPNALVDRAIERNGWRQLTIERTCDPLDDLGWLERTVIGIGMERSCP